MSFVWGVLTGLFIREIADYLPSIGRWLIKRSVRGLTEPAQIALREKRLNFATKLPGGLTKVLWGITCNWLGPQVEPANPATAARLVRALFFLVYLKLTAHDFIRLRFASPRQLKLRWQMMRMFADQAIAVRDPNAKQPMLELAQRLQRLEEIKQQLSALEDAMRENRKQ